MSKWKYRLKLVICPVCINEQTVPYNCHQCNDFGEYWVATMKDGSQRVIQIGKLEPNTQRLASERVSKGA